MGNDQKKKGGKKDKRGNDAGSNPQDSGNKTDGQSGESDLENFDGTGTEPEHLMTEQEFNAAFKHPPRRETPKKESNVGQVVNAEGADDRHLSVFRDPVINEPFRQNNIEIRSTLKYGKSVSVYKAGLIGTKVLLAIKMVDIAEMSRDDCQLYKNDIDIRKVLLERRSHTGILKTWHILGFPDKKKHFLVLEFASRGSLYDIMFDNGPMEETMAAKMFFYLYKALRYLHFNMNIVHRNITLESILVSDRGLPKLTDFKNAVKCTNRKQELNTAVGKAEYLAPEVLSLREKKKYSPFPADIWSLGVIFFMMLNDGKPYRAGNLDALYQEQQNRNLRWRELVLDDISPDVKRLVERILEPNINIRLNLHDLKRQLYLQNIEKIIKEERTAAKARQEQT